MEIRIDSEFQNIIPSLTDEEYSGLEESIQNEGCRDAIIIWNGIIIDGHNRHKICVENGIEFQTVEKHFDSRTDAKVWIIKNQFGRRNLSIYQRGKLALRLKPLIAEKAKEQQLASLKQYKDTVCQNSDKRTEPIDTKDVIYLIG